MTATAPRCRNEGGSASVELVMLTIPIMVMVAFAVFVGRYSSANQDVHSAARDAARAAAVRQFPGQAVADGDAAARTTLINQSVTCRQLLVDVDASQLHPGGVVTATIECVLHMSDLAGFGMPGTTTVEASSSAVVDNFRGGDRP